MRLKTRVGLSIGFSGFFYAYVVYRALLEIMAEGAESGRLFGSYSWQWVAVFAAIILYGLIAVGTSLALATRPHRIFKIHANFQKRIPGWLAWASFVFGTIIMVYFMFVHRYSDHLRTAGIRWMIIIPWLIWITLLLPPLRQNNSPTYRAWLVKGLVVSLIFFAMYAIFARLARTTDYPFMLSWSEGNRFYDYSLIFARDLYQNTGPMDTPYFSPGRYGLWGILFLIKGLPIEVHRAWDAVLWALAPFLFSLAATQQIRRRWLRWSVTLWGGLFLMQGPTYPMILLAGTLVLALQNTSPLKKALPVALGSLYAAVSRWTWMFCGGYWAALVELFTRYPKRRGNPIRRLTSTIIMTGIGLVTGAAAYFIFFKNSATVDLPFNQPLLLYRLWPNSTYPPGILMGTFIAAGPAVLLLVWLALTKRWKMDWLQALAVFGGLAATLTAGAVISTKIGGGSNLHNMDMFMCSLVVLVALAVKDLNLSEQPVNFRPFAQVLVAAAVVAPCMYTVANSSRLGLPPQAEIDYAVDVLQKEVAAINNMDGDILFLDQRQLVTFGVVPETPFHPEYEKKVLMDMAMAGNAQYFQNMYADLREQKYDLIISEILNPRYVAQSGNFSEENNAWSKWVARPILCYYTPKVDLDKVGIQVLIPRAEPCTTPLPTQ